MIQVLIVDNHEVVRNGLRAMLESCENIEVIGEAADGAQAIRMTEELNSDVAIMDVRMPKVDGVTACREITKNQPDTKVIMLSIYDDDDDLFSAIDAGASGFMIKNLSSEDLCDVIEVVSEGRSYFHPIIAQKIADRYRHESGREKQKHGLLSLLTKRETEVLELLGRGLSNSDIAGKLYISEGTVKSHVSNLLRKLDCHDRTQLALLAHEKGLIN